MGPGDSVKRLGEVKHKEIGGDNQVLTGVLQ